MSVYSKLQQARITLQNMPMKKSGLNKFAGYSYFELGDFLPQVNQIFADLKLCSITSFTAELASLLVVDTEDNSEVTFTSPMADAALKGCHPIQNLGAVQTYQRRYLYVCALEIVEHDALDSTTGSDKKNVSSKPTDGAMDGLSEEDQSQVKKACTAILYITDNGLDLSLESVQAAYNEGSVLDNDQRVALFGMLGSYSKLRRAIKDYSETLKKEAE